MQLLVIDRDRARQERAVIAGLEAGYFATGTASLRVAEEVLTRTPVHLLLADVATLEDALGDTLGLAEERNAGVRCVLYSDHVALDHAELSGAFPGLVGVLGAGLDPLVALGLGAPRAAPVRVQATLDAAPSVPVWRRHARTTVGLAA
ncbi:MAG: hypothetical protein AAGM84_07070 [Pseudomonadota bacterium]